MHVGQHSRGSMEQDLELIQKGLGKYLKNVTGAEIFGKFSFHTCNSKPGGTRVLK